MKRISPILAALMIAVTVSAVAVTAQPAFSAQDAEKAAPPPPPPGPRMLWMHRGWGMGGPMGPMEAMPMAEMIHNNPKLAGRLMELRGEMMVTMGQALIKRGKELQQGK